VGGSRTTLLKFIHIQYPAGNSGSFQPARKEIRTLSRFVHQRSLGVA
jgi:hypothetical protein